MVRVLVTLVAGTLATTSLAADYVGTYKGDVNVVSGGGSGRLTYSLKLDKNGKAELNVQRSGTVDDAPSVRREYGQITEFVQRDGKAKQTGTWETDDDDIAVHLDEVLYAGRTESLRAWIHFRPDGTTLRSSDIDGDLYGHDTKLILKKDTSNAGRDLLIAAGAVLAGAAIINATQGSGGSKPGEWDRDGWRFDSRGEGRASLRSGDRSMLDGASFDLSRNGNFVLNLRGSFRVEVRGTWTFSGRGYDLRVSEVGWDRRREKASGRGTIEMHSDRRTPFRVNLDFDMRNEGRGNVNYETRTGYQGGTTNLPSGDRGLNYETNGRGPLRFEDGRALDIMGARFNLNRNGEFEISLRAVQRVVLNGTWTKANYGYQLRFRNMAIDNRSEAVSGDGAIDMNSDGRTANRFSFNLRTKSRGNGRLTFNPARG